MSPAIKTALKAGGLAVFSVAGFLAFCLVIVAIVIFGGMAPGQ